MRFIRDPIGALAWAVLLALSCSSPTGVDRSAGTDVAAVSVDPPSPTVIIGADVPLRAAVMDADGNLVPDAPVVWTVRDADIAVVSASGVVTGRAVGSTQVAASAGGRSAVATVTVQPPPVASVVVQPGTTSLAPGSSTTLKVVVTDVNGAPAPDRAVTWTTSDALVAVVSTTGVVTAVGPGSATIGAESEGKSGTATVTVSPVPAASVTVEPGSVTIQVGRSTPLTATVKDAAGNVLAGRTVAWSSSNPNVASVSATGSVGAVAVGSATISATTNGRSGTSTVTVTLVPVANVAVKPTSASLTVGQTTTLAAVVTDANGATTDRSVSWTSGNEQVATVSSGGVVTAVAPGQATITASSEGKNGAATINVAVSPVASVAVSPPSSTLAVGETTTLAATVRDARGLIVADRVVTWKSDNTTVASVSAGVVTALSAGSAIITATSEGKSGTAAVSVATVPVGSVSVGPTPKSLVAGTTTTLVATVKDANGVVVTDRFVSWSTSDPLVATVSSSGVVSAVAPGSATITATSEGKSGSSAITVTPIPVASVTVLPPTMTLVAGQTATATAVLKDANGNVLTGRVVSWTSSNPLIASVSGAGVVTGVAPGGPVIITASSEGSNGSTSVTVTPVPVGSVTLPSTATLVAGQSTTLIPVVKDANGTIVTDRAVTWSSSNTNVATVSAGGLVRSLITGTATITATSEGKSASTTLTVTPAPVGSVTVAPFTLTLASGSTVTLAATVKDVNGTTVTDRTVTWTSSDENVVTVSSTGVLTGLVAGTATITATSESRSGTATVTVVPGPAAAVTVTPPTASVKDGSTIQLSASAVDAHGNAITGRAFTWTSNSGATASVSPTGIVTGKKTGTATITAALDGAKDSSQVTVTR